MIVKIIIKGNTMTELNILIEKCQNILSDPHLSVISPFELVNALGEIRRESSEKKKKLVDELKLEAYQLALTQEFGDGFTLAEQIVEKTKGTPSELSVFTMYDEIYVCAKLHSNRCSAFYITGELATNNFTFSDQNDDAYTVLGNLTAARFNTIRTQYLSKLGVPMIPVELIEDIIRNQHDFNQHNGDSDLTLIDQQDLVKDIKEQWSKPF